MAIDAGDFGPADEYEWPTIEYAVKWRDKTTGKLGSETFTFAADVPQGVLIDLEAQEPGGFRGLLIDTLLTDDGEKDDNGDQKPGTSSRERWNALTHHATRQIPKAAPMTIARGLWNTYLERRTPTAAPALPTGQPAPSTTAPPQTGTTSTDVPSVPVSTSEPVPLPVG